MSSRGWTNRYPNERPNPRSNSTSPQTQLRNDKSTSSAVCSCPPRVPFDAGTGEQRLPSSQVESSSLGRAIRLDTPSGSSGSAVSVRAACPMGYCKWFAATSYKVGLPLRLTSRASRRAICELLLCPTSYLPWESVLRAAWAIASWSQLLSSLGWVRRSRGQDRARPNTTDGSPRGMLGDPLLALRPAGWCESQG